MFSLTEQSREEEDLHIPRIGDFILLILKLEAQADLVAIQEAIQFLMIVKLAFQSANIFIILPILLLTFIGIGLTVLR